ncbi:hypothetical protein FRC10_012054 [Ceratobasidium sp. 414]|nr:hypothetical protein FRC10_012054 [Ceratobasidium sp. 414]
MNSPRYIALAGLCRVVGTEVPDNKKPNSRVVKCDFSFSRTGLVTIPTFVYTEESDPLKDETAFVTGEFFFPPGSSEGWIQATAFKVISAANLAKVLLLSPPSIYAVGLIATVIDREWYLDVGVFDRKMGRNLTFQVVVEIPDNNRFKKLQKPRIVETNGFNM